MHAHAGRHRLGQFGLALAGAGEADAGRVHAGVEGDLHFAAGGHVQAVHQSGQVLDQGRHRVGLDRVVQFQPGRQRGAQLLHAPGHQGAVIGIERRAADPLGEPGEGDAAHLQAVVGDGKQGLGRVDGLAAHGAGLSNRVV